MMQPANIISGKSPYVIHAEVVLVELEVGKGTAQVERLGPVDEGTLANRAATSHITISLNI